MNKIEWPWKRKQITLEHDLHAVEYQLEQLLQPVKPRAEFVNQLRTDLVGKPRRKWLGVASEGWQKGLLVAGGVVSFAAMVIGGAKIVGTILGQRQTTKGRVSKKAAAL
jgi:hypothetical protein